MHCRTVEDDGGRMSDQGAVARWRALTDPGDEFPLTRPGVLSLLSRYRHPLL